MIPNKWSFAKQSGFKSRKCDQKVPRQAETKTDGVLGGSVGMRGKSSLNEKVIIILSLNQSEYHNAYNEVYCQHF